MDCVILNFKDTYTSLIEYMSNKGAFINQSGPFNIHFRVCLSIFKENIANTHKPHIYMSAQN